MRYAYLYGKRVEAEKGIRKAICPACGSPVLPACGNIYVPHFRHVLSKECDSWYEPMSKWHIEWQNLFPESFREVVVVMDQKKHIADIKTNKGVVIEFQNSPISSADIEDRELFYDKMVWIFNETGNENFYVDKENENYTWCHVKKSIFTCRKPVFIDKGGDYLYWINKYSVEMPQFRLKKGTDFKSYGATCIVRSGFFESYSYWGCYPASPILKRNFVKHYCI